MLLEQTLDKLIAMKLFALAKSLKERLERQDHQSLSKAEFIGLLVDDEWLHRENRKLSARLRVAKFKDRAASIEGLNYKTARGLRKDQLLELAQNRWITSPISRCSSPDSAVPERALSRKLSASTPVAAASASSTYVCLHS
jgi:DNA replication protein DnaC